IVKFSEQAAKNLHQKLKSGQSPSELRLSGQSQRRVKLRGIKPLCPNFQQRRKDTQALGNKDQSQLSNREKRIIARLGRAKKGAKVPDLGRIYKIEIEPGPDESLSDILEQWQSSPDVEYACFNYIVGTTAAPNDPLYPLQWSLDNIGQMYPESGMYNPPPGTPDSDIDAPAAWNLTTDATDIVVAVIDSGIDYNHQDIDENMWINEAELNGVAGEDDDDNDFIDDIYGYDFKNDDGDPMDDNGHGTHVAGTIAAEGNNEFDIAGVCWNGRIMAVKFLGSNAKGDVADAVEAVYYAVENGADILSNSWGGLPLPGNFPFALQDAFEYAYSQGVISVASAGNDNSDFINFPAIFDNVVSVGATNSNDQKAPFSDYGPLVDIAAPGVDILSLRAAGTSRGTPYDANTTIMSGTSMACPHVSGVFALLLSYYPGVGADEATDMIFQSTDYISSDFTVWGRLNAYKPLWLIAGLYHGSVYFDRSVYSCSDTIGVVVSDLNLDRIEDQFVVLSTSQGDLETVLLQVDEDVAGLFRCTIDSSFGEPNIEDGTLQLTHGQNITVTYYDTDDGTGNPAQAHDTAPSDCVAPNIFNIQIDVPGPDPNVTFNTNEQTTAIIRVSSECSEPNIISKSDPALRTTHSIKLTGVSPNTDYFFIVSATDKAGNEAINDNNGLCHPFTTDGPRDIYVPSEYPNIQEAIYRAWDSSTILLADGIYTGLGNRDVDFISRAVTVKGQNGPENCIIDCNGSEEDPHFAFNFQNNEDANSVIDGLTIKNGFSNATQYGGAITCLFSSPTITRCIIMDNTAVHGGGISCRHASPTISRCHITRNSAKYGGGISSVELNPVIINCVLSGNKAEIGAGMWCRVGGAIVANSTFVGNIAENRAGGLISFYSNETVTNCIFWGNEAALFAQVWISTEPTYCCIQDSQGGGLGNIDVDPCFVDSGHWDPNDTLDDANDDFWVPGDYHLRSFGWRWDSDANQWTWDLVTSRAVDAGNPGSCLRDEPLTLEVDPLNRAGINLRINMGAYGLTEQASMGPYDWTLRADLNNDGTVDFTDMGFWTLDWLDIGLDKPGDLDRNTIVDLSDYALLTGLWNKETLWHQ
ncbi:MAG: S8 family serine peptidase, partial [Planctomycetota bacterium]